MSQDRRTHQRVLDPVAEPTRLEFGSVDADADKVMEELFSDIERMLDGSFNLPTSRAQPEYVSLSPLKVRQMTLPLTVRSLIEQLTQQPNNPPNACETPVEENTRVAHSDKALPQAVDSPGLFDKILLGAAFGSMAATLIVWLSSQHWLNRLLSHNPPSAPVPQKTQISQPDAKFIDYMLRSLQAIDRRSQAQKQLARANVQPSSNLPPVPTPGNITQNPNPVPTGISKPYIPPAYPSARGPYPSLTPSPTASTSGPMLVGLIVQGAQSVAMFNINGKTRQIHLGEEIGNSGWKLVSVTLKEAIIRRNRETRSIYFGQQL